MRNENVKFDHNGLYSDHNQLGDTKNKETSWLTVSLLMVSLKVDCKNKCPTDPSRLAAMMASTCLPSFL
jgi:hypothetical protein